MDRLQRHLVADRQHPLGALLCPHCHTGPRQEACLPHSLGESIPFLDDSFCVERSLPK